MDSTDRHIMWTNLIGERYRLMDQTEKKQARKHYAMNRGKKPGDFQPETAYTKDWVTDSLIFPRDTMKTLDITARTSNALKTTPIQLAPLSCETWEWLNNQSWFDIVRGQAMLIEFAQKKEETTMENLIQDTKRHLRNRLDRVENSKRYELDKAFFIEDEKEPKNIEEAVERFAKGMYEVEKKDELSDDDWDGWTSRLRWRNPTNKPDFAGRNAAKERLHKAYQRAVDDIQVLTPEEGLKALREFEDTDFSKV